MVYEKNRDIYNKIYDGFLCKNEYISNSKIKGMLDALFDDPDIMDEALLERAKQYTEKYGVDISPDGLCGWKILYDVYGAENNWIEKYCTIRGSKYGEFYWPSRIIDRNQTINQERSIYLGDRIDLTLFEIKLYLSGETAKKMTFENNKDTQTFLRNFKNKFSDFCKEFDLFDVFVDKETGEVWDISVEDKTSYINEDIVSEFSWSNRLSVDRKKDLLQDYLDNLVKLCGKYPKVTDDKGGK